MQIIIKSYCFNIYYYGTGEEQHVEKAVCINPRAKRKLLHMAVYI